MSKEVLLKVCKVVAAEYGIFPKEMKEKRRLQNIVFARMAFTKICKNQFHIRQYEIAKFLKQSQSNINIYLRKFESENKFNAEFRNKFKMITEKVKEKALTKGVSN
ncbi:hypothetical protein [Chryseobacterium aquaticum]|uniref:Chromosomal replication initiator DnaA C-terminal domain-containing protein n=1 Tax=Chryseobacterium aquaticum subsp. greenlandense TaxID=345663 RepID=A0A101CD85_9FLAO|nr:hypothetical protein [Chryseobacterium aquaticum]KUJ54020.1 hypothetical protein AR686_17690 [Chryseobacterium aquaticum subsp. greenlandense]